MLRFFISYRRADPDGVVLAHMIFRELRYRYGVGSAFLDVDSSSPGLSFAVKVATALSKSDAVLVIIGSAWLAELEARRNDSRDWVRYEIAESLKRQFLPVVPVCRDGVDIPKSHELPTEIADLAEREGVSLDPFADFDARLGRFLTNLERVIGELAEERAAHEAKKRAAITSLCTVLRQVAQGKQLEAERRREAIGRIASLLQRKAGPRPPGSAS